MDPSYDTITGTYAHAGQDQPTAPTLDNAGFADLSLVILAGVVIISATWDWVRR